LANTAATEAKAKQESAEADRSAVVNALAAAGVKPAADKPFAEAVPAAIESRISSRARELVAASGGPLLDDKASADATNKGGKTQMNRADFSNLSPSAQSNFCAEIRKGKAELLD
jgi:hypothetical protein